MRTGGEVKVVGGLNGAFTEDHTRALVHGLLTSSARGATPCAVFAQGALSTGDNGHAAAGGCARAARRRLVAAIECHLRLRALRCALKRPPARPRLYIETPGPLSSFLLVAEALYSPQVRTRSGRRPQQSCRPRTVAPQKQRVQEPPPTVSHHAGGLLTAMTLRGAPARRRPPATCPLSTPHPPSQLPPPAMARRVAALVLLLLIALAVPAAYGERAGSACARARSR